MGKKRRIIIVGLPLFAKRLSEALTPRMTDWDVVHLDTYSKRIDQLKGLYLIPRADIIYSINGTLNNSKVFDLALKNKRKCIMHWVGTDVLDAIQAYEKGDYIPDFINKVSHFCEVGWIYNELQSVGITAKILNFASFEKRYELCFPKVAGLKILSYMSDGRAEFYGLPKLLGLAQKFPEVDFTIVGATAHKFEPLPNNVKALGWVENMDTYFDDCHATIRMPQHDGLSNFVLESLARGKTVFYNHPYPNCTFCPDQIDFELALNQLSEAVKMGNYMPNESGKAFIEKEFNADFVFSQLAHEFNALLG